MADQSQKVHVGSFGAPGIVGPITVGIIKFLKVAEATEEKLNGWILFEAGQIGK